MFVQQLGSGGVVKMGGVPRVSRSSGLVGFMEGFGIWFLGL